MPPRHNRKKAPKVPSQPPLTHFLCLPLINSTSEAQLLSSLDTFTNEVSRHSPPSDTNQTSPKPIHAQAVRPAGTLHLTLGVMSLDAEKLSLASAYLQSLDLRSLLRQAHERQKQSQPSPDPSTPSDLPLTISLTGLQSMHPPAKTSIIYTAPHDPTNRLQTFSQLIHDSFTNAGFLIPQHRDLVLHATIINTVYAPKPGRRRKPQLGFSAKQQTFAASSSSTSAAPLISIAGVDKPRGETSSEEESGNDNADDRARGHGPDAQSRKIDGRELLSKYEDFVWAKDVQLERLAICAMGAKKVLDAEGRVVGEKYVEVASVKLPG